MLLTIDVISLLGFFASLNLIYLGVIAWWEDRSLLATRIFVAMALLSAWSAFTIALVYSGVALAHPRLLFLSQLLSGFNGPLLLLFTLAYLGVLTQWRARYFWILLPGAFGTVGFLRILTKAMTDGELTRLREGLQAFLMTGESPSALFVELYGRGFGLLQTGHSLQWLIFTLVSIGAYLRYASRASDRTTGGEARLLALIFATMLAAVFFANIMPWLGGASYWPRLAPVLSLPFVFVLWTFLQRRIATAKRLKAERETLAAYLPATAVQHILAEGEGTSGARRMEAAVLFTDIRGFTTLSEHIEPAALVQWIDRYFGKMTEIILEEDGMVDKLIGDAILAVFGVPYEVAGPCERAWRSALRMQTALDDLNRECPPASGVTIRMGIGIHFGPLIAGSVGRKQRTFTIFGDTVNTTNRLEAMTKSVGADIVVSEEVYRRLPKEEQERFSPLGALELRGKAAPMSLYGFGQAARTT